MKTQYLIVYGGDSRRNGTECGPETRLRCDAALSFIKENPHWEFIIILGAGKRPDKVDHPPLSTIMRSYMQDRSAESPASNIRMYIAAEHKSWGTLAETAYAVMHVTGKTSEVYVCSSFYHLFRIRLLWRLLKQTISVQRVSVPSFNLINILLEPLKILKALIIR